MGNNDRAAVPAQDTRTRLRTIKARANRAAFCATLGVFAYPLAPLFALAGWAFGRSALNGIRSAGIGQQHRAAAQFGVICGWFTLVELGIAVVAMSKSG